jgi:hypothetical protein
MSRSLAVLLVGTLLLGACSDSANDSAVPSSTSTLPGGGAIDVAGAPQSFYAVRDPAPPPPGQPHHDTQIVEVETATGRVLRTVVDVGPSREPRADGEEEFDTIIGALDLAPDGRTLWYSAGASPFRTAVFQVALPEGTPEEIATGRDPSVSADGRRLAWIDGTTIRIRDLDDGTEQTLPEAFDLEGYDTTWSTDATKLAFLTGGVDSFGATTVDIATGRPIIPQPAEETPGVQYTPYAPRYRPSDGLLVVACCGEIPDPPPDLVPPPSAFVLHDPATGAERERINLSIDPRAHDYDASGAHHLVSTIEGDVYLDRNGELIHIPEITGVSELAW